MKTTIISGFPGIGKTSARHVASGLHVVILDMESTPYAWVYDYFDLDEPRKRNPNFPKNYVDALELFVKKGDYTYILISSHEEVRSELRKRGIKYLIVAPKNTAEMKNEYCKRYLRRGSDIGLISKIYREWDEMFESIKADPSLCVWLDSGEYLADVLSKEGE